MSDSSRDSTSGESSPSNAVPSHLESTQEESNSTSRSQPAETQNAKSTPTTAESGDLAALEGALENMKITQINYKTAQSANQQLQETTAEMTDETSRGLQNEANLEPGRDALWDAKSVLQNPISLPIAPHDEVSSVVSEELTYETTDGHATDTSLDYEVKMLALVYLRALKTGQSFFLGSNVKAAGKFDDIVLIIREVVEGRAAWKTYLVQLKHRENPSKNHGQGKMGSGKNDEGMMYFESYTKVQNNAKTLAKYTAKYYYKIQGDTLAEAQIQDADFDDVKYILYTNAIVDEEMIGALNTFGEDDCHNDLMFLSTTKKRAVKFNEKSAFCQRIQQNINGAKIFLENLLKLSGEQINSEIDKISRSQQNNSILESKLNSLKSSFEQSSSKDIESKINTQIGTLVGDGETCKSFLSSFYYHTDQAGEKELSSLLQKEIMDIFKMNDTADVNEMEKTLCGFVKKWWKRKGTNDWKIRNSFPLTLTRIMQVSRSKASELKQKPVTFHPDSFSLQENSHKIIVEVDDGSTDLFLTKMLQNIYHERLQNTRTGDYIFTGLNNLLKLKEEIFIILPNKLCEGIIIDCEDCWMDQESKLKDLAKDMNKIQGQPPSFQILLVSCDNKLFSHFSEEGYATLHTNFEWNNLSGESQTALLSSHGVIFQGYKIQLGYLLGKIVDREPLNCFNEIRGETMTQVLQGRFCIGKSLDNNTNVILRNSIIPNDTPSPPDPPERIKLLVGMSGSGKSFFTIQKARENKKADISKLVVCIKMSECCEFLSKPLSTNSFIEFLLMFSTNNCDSKFERTVFERFIKVTGNMMVILDGVDAVYPDYENSMCSLLEQLKTTKIRDVLITSRHIAKDSLMKVLELQSSYEIESFSAEEQKRFFMDHWKDRMSFAADVLTLLGNAIKDKNILSLIAIPQHTRLLAEFIDGKVNNIAGGKCTSLPKSIKIDKDDLLNSIVKHKIRSLLDESVHYNNKIPLVEVDIEELEGQIHDYHIKAAKVYVAWSNKRALKLICTDFSDKEKRVLQKSGIVFFVDNKPEFVVKALAEFLANTKLGKRRNTQSKDKIQTKRSRK